MKFSQPFYRGGCLAGMAVAALLLWHSHGLYRFDDPYITMVYARNLLEGRGLTFNPGERVMGFTSPLHVFLLAALGALGGPEALPALGAMFSIAGIAAAGWMLAAMAAPDERGAACAAALLFVFNECLVKSIGLETSLYMASIIAAVWAWEQRREAASAFCLALATLTRLEALLLALMLAGLQWRRTRRPPSSAAMLIYAAMLTPWLSWATWYYGSPLPNTLAAKIEQGTDPAWREPLVRRIARAVESFPLLYAMWAVPCGAVTLYRGKYRAYVPLVLFGLLQWSAYFLVLHVASIYSWYYVPSQLALSILAGVGLIQTARWSWSAAHGGLPKRWAGIAALMALGALGLYLSAEILRRHAARRVGVHPHVLSMERAAEWMERHLPPDAVVEQGEVGVLGWRCRRRINDLGGLVSTPATVRAHTATVKLVSRYSEPRLYLPPDAWVCVHRVDVAASRKSPDAEVWVRPEIAERLGLPAASEPHDGRGD